MVVGFRFTNVIMNKPYPPILVDEHACRVQEDSTEERVLKLVQHKSVLFTSS